MIAFLFGSDLRVQAHQVPLFTEWMTSAIKMVGETWDRQTPEPFDVVFTKDGVDAEKVAVCLVPLGVSVFDAVMTGIGSAMGIVRA